MKNLGYSVPEDLIYGISQIEDGNLSCTWGKAKEVEDNRAKFLRKLGLSIKDCVHMHLEHGDKVFVVGKDDLGRGMMCGKDDLVCDAMVTRDLGVSLFVLTADCLPITFFDPENMVLGLSHASRMNSEMDFTKRVIEVMKKEGAEPKNTKVYMGPCITKDSYFMDYFDSERRSLWGEYASDMDDGRVSLDIVGYNKMQLLDTGIHKENITISGIDTYRSKDYFSHYRSKTSGEREGRFATIAGMKIT